MERVIPPKTVLAARPISATVDVLSSLDSLIPSYKGSYLICSTANLTMITFYVIALLNKPIARFTHVACREIFQVNKEPR